MRASILLKCSCIGGTKANNCINFGVNLFNIQGVISDFTHKTKSNICQTYRVNCFMEQAENQSVAGLNITGVPFGS